MAELKEILKHPIHTTLYNNFFLLRTEVVINGQQATVESDEEGWLTLNCRYPRVGVTFDSLVTDINEVLQRHGMEGVTNYWCEEVPLFELKISSQEELKKLLHLEEKIKRDFASKIAARMTSRLQSPGQGSPLPSLDVRVQPQVFLLAPSYAPHNAKVTRIIKENITTCMSLFGDSKMFEFEALFRALRTNPSLEDKGPEHIQQLSYELCEVVDWYHLGLHLKVDVSRLKIIARDHPQHTERCRTEMLSWWMDNTVERKWATVVQALLRVGSRVLARKIALKYGIPDPSVLHGKERAPMAAQWSCPQRLGAEINGLRLDIEYEDEELHQGDRKLKQAEQDRMSIAEGLTAIMQKVQKAKSRVEQLLQEKSSLEKTLKLREHQLQLQQQSATREREWQHQFISLQQKEIVGLEKQLKRMESELDQTKPQLLSLQKGLQEVSLELAKKSSEVQRLQQVQEAMKLKLEVDRKRLDECVQAATFSSAFEQQQAQNLKEEVQVKSKEMKTLSKALEQKDEEMKKLARHIASQEAHLQRILPSDVTQIPDEHQLQECIKILHDLENSRMCLADEEEGRRVISTKMMLLQLLQSDAGHHQKHAHSVIREPRAGSFKLSLKWNTRMSAPQRVYRGAAVAHGNTIHVIGHGSHTVHSYKLDTNVWRHNELSPCPHIKPGLIIVNNLLTAVGGQERDHLTNKLVSWKHGVWVEMVPPMQTRRKEPGLISNETHVVVVGGDRKGKEVEVFHISSQIWSTVTSLPTPLQYITATLCHDDIIAVGRYGSAYAISMTALISKPTQWTSLPTCQHWSTLTTFRGRTLLVHYHGIDELREGKWERIGNMAVPKALPIVCVAGDQMVVVGGCDRFLPPSVGGLDLNTTTTTVRVATLV